MNWILRLRGIDGLAHFKAIFTLSKRSLYKDIEKSLKSKSKIHGFFKKLNSSFWPKQSHLKVKFRFLS